MSRIVQFTRCDAPEVLEFKDIQIPAPADNEARECRGFSHIGK